MSSDLLFALKKLQLFGCGPVITITIVGYDYFLTLSREVNTIWCRPWTFVSTLFVIVRYVGLCWVVILALAGSRYLQGPVDLCIALVAIGDWGYLIFLAAADLVMILRVYAMWNRSKTILGVLLFIYVPQIVVTIFWEVVYVSPYKTLTVTIAEVFDIKICSFSSTAPPGTYRSIPRFVFGAVLLTLAIVPTLTQSVETYKITKRWQTNRSLKLLVKEGFVYFVVYVSLVPLCYFHMSIVRPRPTSLQKTTNHLDAFPWIRNVLFNLVNSIQLPSNDLTLFVNTFSYSLSAALMPRFIMSIRELYNHDAQDRWRGVDSGFSVFQEISSAYQGAPALNLSRGRGSEAIELGQVRGGVWRA